MKIALTSIPKSGTHLLAKFLEIITGEYCVTLNKNVLPNSYYAKKAMRKSVVGGHLRIKKIMTEEFFHFFDKRKIIVLIRDPRDICNSMVYHIANSNLTEHKIIYDSIRHLSHEDKIRCIAEGININKIDTIMRPLDIMCRGFIEVADHFSDCIILRYEDFFGEKKILKNISDFLEVTPDITRDAIAKALGSDTKTKRIGKSQNWRETFSPELINYFAVQHSDVIRYLGYEV